MTVFIINKTPHNIDIWLNVAGGMKYWDNNVGPEEVRDHHPGWVWYDVHVKLNTGSDNELNVGGAILQGIIPIMGLPGAIITGLVQGDVIKNSGSLPEWMKKALDSGAVDVDKKVVINDVEWTNVYGGGDDKTFEVRGGNLSYTEVDGRIKVTGFEPLVLAKTTG